VALRPSAVAKPGTAVTYEDPKQYPLNELVHQG
jgi:hypothetical protein